QASPPARSRLLTQYAARPHGAGVALRGGWYLYSTPPGRIEGSHPGLTADNFMETLTAGDFMEIRARRPEVRGGILIITVLLLFFLGGLAGTLLAVQFHRGRLKAQYSNKIGALYNAEG